LRDEGPDLRGRSAGKSPGGSRLFSVRGRSLATQTALFRAVGKILPCASAFSRCCRYPAHAVRGNVVKEMPILKYLVEAQHPEERAPCLRGAESRVSAQRLPR